MENEKVNISEELDRLENQIGIIIVGSTETEAQEVKKKINKLVQNVEEILVSEAGIPRGNASRIIENMQENLNYQIGRNLTGARQSEYDETKANLATVEQAELQDTSDELARFQNEGVTLKDNKYCANIEEICEEVIRDYRIKLGKLGARGAEEAYLNIKYQIRRASNSIQDIHGDYSRKIKQDISNRVGELGLKLTATLEAQIEQTVDAKAQEEFVDLKKTLQDARVSEEDLAKADAQDLSENKKAFKDVPTHDGNTRKDLESMFK